MPINPNLGGGGGDYSPPGSGGSGAGGSGGPGGGVGGSSGGGVGSAPGVSPVQAFSTAVYTVTRDATDRPQYGPGVDVGPRDTVTVTPVSTNTVNAFISVASGPDAAKSGPRIPLAASSVPRNVRVRNLNEIGVYSTVVGEGVTIEHLKAG